MSAAAPPSRESPPEVVFWYSALNPYMAQRFSELAQRGNVRFECWFNWERDPERSWVVPDTLRAFPYRFVRAVPGTSGRIGIPPTPPWREPPQLLVTFHGNPAVALSLGQHLAPHGKLVYYVERTFDTWTQRASWKEVSKRLLFRRADGFLSPGCDADAYARSYAGDDAVIRRLDHVVDVDHFQLALPLRAARRRAATAPFTFLYLGRIWWQKGIGTLLEAFGALRRSGVDARLLLAGDGCDIAAYRASLTPELEPSVRFAPFTQLDGLPGVFATADALVFPTRGDPYGLVVDEAMASGLPVVATTAAGEIHTRVLDGETGLLVPPDDPQALEVALAHLAENPAAAEAMGDRAHALCRSRTPAHWATQLEAAVRTFVDR